MNVIGKYFYTEGKIIKIISIDNKNYAMGKIMNCDQEYLQRYKGIIGIRSIIKFLESVEEMPEYGTPLYKAMYEKI